VTDTAGDWAVFYSAWAAWGLCPLHIRCTLGLFPAVLLGLPPSLRLALLTFGELCGHAVPGAYTEMDSATFALGSAYPLKPYLTGGTAPPPLHTGVGRSFRYMVGNLAIAGRV